MEAELRAAAEAYEALTVVPCRGIIQRVDAATVRLHGLPDLLACADDPVAMRRCEDEAAHHEAKMFEMRRRERDGSGEEDSD